MRKDLFGSLVCAMCLIAVGCSGDVAMNPGDPSGNQNVPRDTQTPPNDTQDPSGANQLAGDQTVPSDTQRTPFNSTSNSDPCPSACAHVTASHCGFVPGADCTVVCRELQGDQGPCGDLGRTLLGCLSVATPLCDEDGDLMEGSPCYQELEAYGECMEEVESEYDDEGVPNSPAPVPSSVGDDRSEAPPSSAVTCSPSDSCAGCTNECDACRCIVDMEGAPSSACDEYC